MDPRIQIRIHLKMSWIRNTGRYQRHRRPVSTTPETNSLPVSWIQMSKTSCLRFIDKNSISYPLLLFFLVEKVTFYSLVCDIFVFLRLSLYVKTYSFFSDIVTLPAYKICFIVLNLLIFFVHFQESINTLGGEIAKMAK